MEGRQGGGGLGSVGGRVAGFGEEVTTVHFHLFLPAEPFKNCSNLPNITFLGNFFFSLSLQNSSVPGAR